MKTKTKPQPKPARVINPNKPHAKRHELAEHFGVAIRTVDTWLADTENPVPHYRRGATVRFSIAEVEEHLKKQKATSN